MHLDISNPVQAEKVKHFQEVIRKDLVEIKPLLEPTVENANQIELNQKNYHLCRYASWIPEMLGVSFEPGFRPVEVVFGHLLTLTFSPR